MHFALLASLALVAVLAFVLFPARRLVVDADGRQVVVVSRSQDVESLLNSAGVARDPGDVLVRGANLVELERAIPVVVEVDGVAMSWRTRAATIDGLLGELEIDVSPYDTVFYGGREVSLDASVYPETVATAALAGGGVFTRDAPVQPVMLHIERAVPLSVVEDGRATNLQSSADTIGEALREAGISLGPADEIYPAPATPLSAGMEVQIRHAKAYTLHIGESSRVLYTHKQTLKAALAESGLVFAENDRVEPSLQSAMTDGMEARLIRVEGQQLLEKEPVEHITVFKPDPYLRGTETRRVEGSDGVKVFEYHIAIEDGVQVEKTLEDTYFDPEPVNTVIYFAESALETANVDPGSLQVRETMRMYATWYNAASSGKEPTHPAYGITRSGAPLTKGIVAVDPTVIPLGTRLFVPGYGFAIAGDTGYGIKGKMIDMGYPDDVPVDWYTGWTDVYILSP